MGYARSTIHALIKEDVSRTFKLVPNGRANGWLEKTIDKWMQDRANQVEHNNYIIAKVIIEWKNILKKKEERSKVVSQ